MQPHLADSSTFTAGFLFSAENQNQRTIISATSICDEVAQSPWRCYWPEAFSAGLHFLPLLRPPASAIPPANSSSPTSCWLVSGRTSRHHRGSYVPGLPYHFVVCARSLTAICDCATLGAGKRFFMFASFARRYGLRGVVSGRDDSPTCGPCRFLNPLP